MTKVSRGRLGVFWGDQLKTKNNCSGILAMGLKRRMGLTSVKKISGLTCNPDFETELHFQGYI